MKKEETRRLVFWAAFLCVSPFLRFTLPLGENAAALSCFSIILPLLFALDVKKYSITIFTGILGVFTLIQLPLTMGIPTLLAALSWKYSKTDNRASFALHFIFPLFAIALFAAAPLVGNGWAYGLYWLIPIIGLFFPRHLWVRALQSTFVAHAAGSLIWAYMVPMKGSSWISLMPVVALERSLAALFSILIITAIQKSATLFLTEPRVVLTKR